VLHLILSGGLRITMPESLPHTSKYAPWKLVTYVAFSDRQKAEAFEHYLKSGSGHAFAKKRLW
jgi:putative endonuclease